MEGLPGTWQVECPSDQELAVVLEEASDYRRHADIHHRRDLVPDRLTQTLAGWLNQIADH